LFDAEGKPIVFKRGITKHAEPAQQETFEFEKNLSKHEPARKPTTPRIPNEQQEIVIDHADSARELNKKPILTAEERTFLTNHNDFFNARRNIPLGELDPADRRVMDMYRMIMGKHFNNPNALFNDIPANHYYVEGVNGVVSDTNKLNIHSQKTRHFIGDAQVLSKNDDTRFHRL
jgi:hypothetical protein